MTGTVFLGLIYLTFISLGLPDPLLGTAWPVMRLELGASLDAAGILSVIISGGTIVSSLCCGRLLERWGAGKVTACSVLLTAGALTLSSVSPSLLPLGLAALPLGLGGGAVDAALNNFVALRYTPRHMSWLHCFWGVGAFAGPLIIARWLSRGDNWRGAYLTLGLIQSGVSLLLFMSLPLWDRPQAGRGGEQRGQEEAGPQGGRAGAGGKKNVLRIPGVPQTLAMFFMYCAFEYIIGLWGASFLIEARGFAKADAARALALYFMGITAGRFGTGFLTMRLNGGALIRVGLAVISAGSLLLLLPLPPPLAPLALLIIGLGCAPVYPSIIHLTPERFGPANSSRIIGLEMACAYCGSTFMPPLAGFAAARTSMAVIPAILLCCGAAMLFMSEKIHKAVKTRKQGSMIR
ncbi:MAG: MFS transporter [Spirochaetaceae bacterium]|jgi:fucose permease|nr:MFS transporter [Spirochaetaceae bacterium]